MTSQMMTSASTISTFRHLYLRSDQADYHYSPTHKTWVLYPMADGANVTFKMTLKCLQINNVFPSVPKTLTLSYQTSTGTNTEISIFPGNWTAPSLAAYLTTQFANSVDKNKVTYDCGSLAFEFDPPIKVHTGKSDCMKELGFWFPTDAYYSLAKSNFPINLESVTQILVDSDMSVFNLPPSGILAGVPVTAEYGALINYHDTDGSESLTVSDHNLNSITIRLLDQDGNDLYRRVPDSTGTYKDIYDQYYSVPTWNLTLVIEAMIA